MSKGALKTHPGTSAEELLSPLLRGDFLLTDARGMVSRWGTSASRLFGWRSEDVVGRSVFDAVLASGGSEWRRYLEVGEGDSPAPSVEAAGKRDDGHKFPLELLFLPVRLSESLELSRLLELVGEDISPEDKLERLGRDNPVALDSMMAAATGTREDSDDSRLAGMVVSYRPLGETPWTEQARPAPAAAPPAVGPSEEQLLRVGKLERGEEELKEAFEAIRSEAAAARREAEAARAEVESARAEAASARMEAEAAGAEAAAARSVAEAARAAIDAVREDASLAREDAAAGRAVADRAHALAGEVQIDAERRRRERVEAERETPRSAQAEPAQATPSRPPREGFDDAGCAMAKIALDGTFEQLNPRFESLVGYSESEFRRARWPSLVDSDNLVEHRELLAALASGDVEQARLDTVYLHGQGLLVPVGGQLELVRAEDDAPSHVVLTVDN